jgi:allantoicase
MGVEEKELSGIGELVDLASERFGGRAVVANDEFFAPKENLLKAGAAVFIPDRFTDKGKWMDGWETRRRREPGNDWVIIKLGRPGMIRAINVDTSHFNGNQPESCVVDGAEFAGDPSVSALSEIDAWTAITERTALGPGSPHKFPVIPGAAARRFTHVRLRIFPDGGVARLRVYGEVVPDWAALTRGGLVDLAGAENGGLVAACNDMHFGSRHNLIMPGRAAHMGDGWETRRKRGLKGGEFDWCVVRLGQRGTIRRVEVDTNHFKGNFPESCMLEVCDAPGQRELDAATWTVLLPRTRLKADTQHVFETELVPGGFVNATHARLSIFPDGGVSRLRLWGTVARP